jgi:hypothetical protein
MKIEIAFATATRSPLSCGIAAAVCASWVGPVRHRGWRPTPPDWPPGDLQIIVLIGEGIAGNRDLGCERAGTDQLSGNLRHDYPFQIAGRIVCRLEIAARCIHRGIKPPE